MIQIDPLKMSRQFLLMLMAFLMSMPVYASVSDADREAGQEPKEVKVGLYLTNLYDIDLNNNQYNVQFWAWFLHEHEDFNPKGRTVVVNSKSWSGSDEFRQESDNQIWDVMFLRAVINEHWNVARYPFDTQELHIHIEDVEETSAGVRYVPDVEGTRIDDDLIPDGWELKGYEIREDDYRYNSTFGDPALADKQYSDFSRLTMVLTIQREGARLFSTVFIGFFVATIFVIVTLAINMSRNIHPVIPLQPRVTLASGAIFATVGSIYLLVSEMPYTTEFTLADSLLVTTSLGTVFCIISSILTDYISKTESANLVYRVNKWLFGIFVLAHFGVNASFLMGWL